MILRRMAWLVGAVTFLSIGCNNGGGGTGGQGGTTAGSSSSGGAGGASSSSSSSSSSTSASSSSSSSGTGGSGGAVDPSGFSCSGATPSLKTDVVPITTARCATAAACHLAAKTPNGVYDQFVNRIAEQCTDLRLMVKPGDPEHSYVIHKMTNHNICSGLTMPKDASLMADAEVQVIYDWICAGAQNN